MPYFKNNNINLLLIHIPKTGGTSLEKYFSKKYNIKLDINSLYTIKNNPEYLLNNVHLQHLTLLNLKDNNKRFKIDWNNLKIITIVRNPYDRILSEIFWRNIKMEKKNNIKTKIDSINKIKEYIQKYKNNNSTLDNHMRPQYEFLLNKEQQIDPNILILKTEDLTEQMKKNGWVDFSNFDNKVINTYKYSDWFNQEILDLINEIYDNDFKYFNYNKIEKI